MNNFKYILIRYWTYRNHYWTNKVGRKCITWSSSWRIKWKGFYVIFWASWNSSNRGWSCRAWVVIHSDCVISLLYCAVRIVMLWAITACIIDIEISVLSSSWAIINMIIRLKYMQVNIWLYIPSQRNSNRSTAHRAWRLSCSILSCVD